MNQTPRKPSRPTRAPTSRPRRVAGQPRPGASESEAEAESEAESEADEDVPDDLPAVDLTKRSVDAVVAAVAPVRSSSAASAQRTEQSSGGHPAGRGRLVALVVALVVLMVLGAGEALYLGGVVGDENVPKSAPASAERPVQLPDLDVRRVVDQAATAGKLILAASSADYDGQVDKAAATMTGPFAEEYRQTKSDIKDQFVAAQTEVVVDISAQGVVTATDDEVVALLFLTQTTQKGTRGGVTPVQYRVTVTMVNTADGWLVSDLQAL